MEPPRRKREAFWKLSREEAALLDRFLLTRISEIYNLWYPMRKHREEPMLTAASMTDEVMQYGSRVRPEAFDYWPRKKITPVVRNALERLKKQRKIASSIGMSQHRRGREARVYEPIDLDRQLRMHEAAQDGSTRPKSARAVEKYIKAKTGETVKLYRGRGYWYFSAPDSGGWSHSSVYVYRIGDQTLDGWLSDYQEIVKESVMHESFDPNVLLRQLGGNKFKVMTGAKNFVYSKADRSLSFKIGRNSKRVNGVRITLDASDTYTMEFMWNTVKKQTTRAKVSGVYAEDLQRVFTEHTGMYTSLGTMGESARKDHYAVYNGKAVSMGYISNAKNQFKMAAMRIVDNGAEGFVITPKDKVFKVTQSSRMAKPVTGRERDDALAELKKLGVNEMTTGANFLAVFNKLKKNDKVQVRYDSTIRKGSEQTLVVTSGKRAVGKARVERIILKNPDNPRGMKYTLYNRNGSVSLALGDMAASMTDISIVEAVSEGGGSDSVDWPMDVIQMYLRFRRGQETHEAFIETCYRHGVDPSLIEPILDARYPEGTPEQSPLGEAQSIRATPFTGANVEIITDKKTQAAAILRYLKRMFKPTVHSAEGHGFRVNAFILDRNPAAAEKYVTDMLRRDGFLAEGVIEITTSEAKRDPLDRLNAGEKLSQAEYDKLIKDIRAGKYDDRDPEEIPDDAWMPTKRVRRRKRGQARRVRRRKDEITTSGTVGGFSGGSGLLVQRKKRKKRALDMIERINAMLEDVTFRKHKVKKARIAQVHSSGSGELVAGPRGSVMLQRGTRADLEAFAKKHNIEITGTVPYSDIEKAQKKLAKDKRSNRAQKMIGKIRSFTQRAQKQPVGALST
jgi:hypothetical protein